MYTNEGLEQHFCNCTRHLFCKPGLILDGDSISPCVGFEILTAGVMQISILILWTLFKVIRHFGGTCRLHLLGSSACHPLSHWFLAQLILWPWRRRRHVPSKRWLTLDCQCYIPEDRTLHLLLCQHNHTGFLCGLFYNTVSIWTIQRRMAGWVMNNKLEMIWKKEISHVVIKVLSDHLHGRTEENHDKSLKSRCPSQDPNHASPKYKSTAYCQTNLFGARPDLGAFRSTTHWEFSSLCNGGKAIREWK
jgi:hypothetical protein